jgi:hypothetical protein
LKEDMSSSEYASFMADSGIEWGKDGVIDEASFLKKTYKEQQEYLSSLEEKY